MLPIIERIYEICGKDNPSVLYLPTAGFDDMDDSEIILKPFKERSTDVNSLLLTDESLTEEDIKNAILSADIIYAGGGNLEFLMNTFKKTKADKYLKEAYENGVVLSGLSSGAMCWFEMGWDDCGEDHSFMFVECLGILKGCFCPHYEGKTWNNFKNAIKTIDFDGMQPLFKHTPPRNPISITATFAPSCDALIAPVKPAGPEPIKTISNSCVII